MTTNYYSPFYWRVIYWVYYQVQNVFWLYKLLGWITSNLITSRICLWPLLSVLQPKQYYDCRSNLGKKKIDDRIGGTGTQNCITRSHFEFKYFLKKTKQLKLLKKFLLFFCLFVKHHYPWTTIKTLCIPEKHFQTILRFFRIQIYFLFF